MCGPFLCAYLFVNQCVCVCVCEGGQGDAIEFSPSLGFEAEPLQYWFCNRCATFCVSPSLSPLAPPDIETVACLNGGRQRDGGRKKKREAERWREEEKERDREKGMYTSEVGENGCIWLLYVFVCVCVY